MHLYRDKEERNEGETTGVKKKKPPPPPEERGNENEERNAQRERNDARRSHVRGDTTNAVYYFFIERAYGVPCEEKERKKGRKKIENVCDDKIAFAIAREER